MDKKFKQGDIVKLKTGTQKMKVIEYYVNIVETIRSNYKQIGDNMSMEYKKVADNEPNETTQVVCEWHTKNNIRQSKRFEEEDLELVK
jgi:uncharacterized protein YodC (DUF2158 family)